MGPERHQGWESQNGPDTVLLDSSARSDFKHGREGMRFAFWNSHSGS